MNLYHRLPIIGNIQQQVGLLCLLAVSVFCTQLSAQTINGDVYGGGKNGNVGDGSHVANPEVNIQGSAVVRTVFGGGLNGQVSGSTTVNILGGSIGATSWKGSPFGGVYGAGEGESAIVNGNATVSITGGVIYNNVYGGGKMATLIGNTLVDVASGEIRGEVYAGARAADIQGYAYAFIHENTLISSVFGGNDIGGNILNTLAASPAFYTSVPSAYKAATMPISFLQIAAGVSTQPFMANLFGGGNGDYTYEPNGEGGFDVSLPNDPADPSQGTFTFKVGNKPELSRTFLDIAGGTFYNVFGGGNMATITESTDVYLHADKTATPITLAAADVAWMPAFDAEAYTGSTDITFKKQIFHLFGGNNVATMAIRPTWHLNSGLVYNIYSGGNKGAMTHPNGILLSLNGANMNVENVYGGCRLSDVKPMTGSSPSTFIDAETMDGYDFPAGYSARVRVTGGTIGNVYGGNDISGSVSFGTNVVIQSDIVNNVYGSGNGSYVYTDIDTSSEYYYDPEGTSGLQSLAKLNLHRPNSEKALITLSGTAGNITYIGGAVYCGGSSATLRSYSGSLTDVGASLELGSYVIANRVFLGSNGENMVTPAILAAYTGASHSADLTDAAQFEEYMKGVEVAVRPNVTFTSNYVTGSSKIGSFYCGGNVGSMTAPGTFNVNFLNSLIIFDKLVAGCNNANVAKTAYNAYHMGGLTTHADTKVRLDIDGLKMEPRKLIYDPITDTFSFQWNKYTEAGLPSEGFLKGGNIYGGCYESGYVDGAVEINIKSDLVTDETYQYIKTVGTDGSGIPLYGFHVHDWSHHSKEQSISTLSAYGGGYGQETEIWGDVTINLLSDGRFLKIRGGSEKGWIGKMTRDADGLLVAGTPYVANNPDGTTTSVATKQVTEAYNTTINMNANLLKQAGNIITNIGDICGGGYEGVVTGNTTVNLNNGCAYQVFGGASNADIYGAAQVFIGESGMPYVTQAVYGGNDFGGQIMGTLNHIATPDDGTGPVIKNIKSNTYINYVAGSIGYAIGELNSAVKPDANFGIFGAANGCYDYDNAKYASYISAAGFTKPNMLKQLAAETGEEAYNSFVNISSISNNKDDKVFNVYGGGEGYAGKMGLADTHNTCVIFNAQNAFDRGGNNNYVAQYVYGGGNCSKTNYTLLDAYKGYAKFIFGGCHGSSDKSQTLTYMGESATVNVYPSLNSPAMDVFGSGALSGTKETNVNLLGGTVNNVYGSTYEEGITYQSNVNVPATSTVAVNAIFGGGKGLSTPNACDTYIAVINYDAPNATVSEALYGGNHDFRMTRNSFLNISVPVKTADNTDVDVYGAGYGVNTFASQTYVNLMGTAKSGTARVKNVYGGGRDGMVLNAPSLAKFLTTYDYYALDDVDATTYLTDTEVAGFETWKTAKGTAVIVDDIHYNNIPAISLATDVASTDLNTQVMIPTGTTVSLNAYGGGFGANATVAGQTDVKLQGGTVTGDIYGGGYGGDVKLVASLPLAATPAQNITSNVLLSGGTTSNSYGGGYEGMVEGDANTIVGRSSCNAAAVTFLDGDPTVNRSLYGGGQNGAVTGTATINYYNGHVGYKYDAVNNLYVDNVNLKATTKLKPDSLLYHNGNVFGGGYGEGAYTTHTILNMWDGTIRNSVYGGGEIASIGWGSTKDAGDGSMNKILDRTKPFSAGDTHLTIYGGNILRDVFGGGRGYSYDLNGNEFTGERFYTDGYVFGSTEVLIHGGTIGTNEGIASGYGNVFGGGNVGFVYSIDGIKATSTSDDKTIGYYYNTSNNLTEDCRVVISPYCKVTAAEGVTINGHSYNQCDFVLTEDLNYLKKTATEWNAIDWHTGVTIKNAVFAGGNVTRGSDKLYANTTTVYGNVTASLNDIYHRDLISVGSDYVGGLYGDGNLTLVDGYREIAIVNYGTDYYTLQSEITIEEYNQLSDRERAYFTLKYKCLQANSGHAVGDQITEDQYKKLDAKYQTTTYWLPSGFCSIYSGRILNTIQRADFCGVHGSRIVLQGAQDRVIDVMDYTNYAINRVSEVSLNKHMSVIAGESEGQTYHGNYFGMYNIVNFLGALTSDVRFTDIRYAKNSTYEADKDHGYIDKPAGGASPRSYYNFKKEKIADKKVQQYRNNATSDNQIAMSQGVYLELVDHLATGPETVGDYTYQAGEKVYGPITGVVELDLINATADMGGGYVYAQNIHGTPSFDASKNAKAILSAYNTGAITNAAYTYTAGESSDHMQSSGNFVHYLKQIVDDCYPNNGVYAQSPAHFWYLRGNVFVYEQYVSAFTGSSTAYMADVQIPLTITSGSHGKLRVMDVKPNYYAYYKTADTPLAPDEKIRANNITYALNDVISYWEYSNLTTTEQALFVPMTYVCKENLYSDSTHTTLAWAKDVVMLPATYETVKDVTYYDKNGIETTGKDWIRISNGTSHDNGFLLTADISNPLEWDDRYIKKIDVDGTKTIYTKKEYEDLITAGTIQASDYSQGPTFVVASKGVYGQRDYQVGDILTQEAVNAYESLGGDKPTTNQATVEKAYISTEPISYISISGESRNVQKGVAIPKSEYDYLITSGQTAALAAFDVAYICTTTFLKGDVYVLYSELYSKADYDALDETYKKNFSLANYCSVAGKYGGAKYESGQNFEALGAYCSMPEGDRDKFTYNFDALDILYNNLEGDWKQGYSTAGSNGEIYTQQVAIEYAATCHTEFTYTPKGGSPTTISVGAEYTSSQFEAIPNEKIHYAKFTTSSANETVYLVKESFAVGSVFYKAGSVVSQSVYTENPTKVGAYTIPNSGTHYFCKESYVVDAQGEGVPVKNEIGGTTYAADATVPVGVVITAANYSSLNNFQNNFSISGMSPVEISTLYVPRMADILDQSKERVVTLIYQYQYEESTADGTETEEVSERHVVNIHIQFKTGVPTIGELSAPSIVLPGSTIGLKQPIVAQGAYEVIGGGWEIYETKEDAKNHENGIAYSNNNTPMYFYHDGYYAAYYTKTYLGKTYSNAVPFKVANYHSIDAVLADKEHHLYIDNPSLKRDCKVYITNKPSTTDPDNKNEIDLLQDLHQLCSVGLPDHSSVNSHIQDCNHLDIMLGENVESKGNWTPIGTMAHCFDGDLHGDGFYIDGLDHSLFNYFCGNVYNLGLNGTFTGAGLAENGSGNATNCWMLTTGTPDANTYPFFGTGAGVLTNCYYHNDFKDPTGLSGWELYKKPLNAFNNGDVAFNLNRYYLKKRYTDTRKSLTSNPYYFYKVNPSDADVLDLYEGYCEDADAPFTYTDIEGNTYKMGYVEWRYFDGDFIYSRGTIPTDVNERLYADDKYFPIYPDDYLFFGQMLSYNYIEGRPHQEFPTAVVRTAANRVQTSNNTSTRVYRTPAYYGNKNMSLAYFNVNAVVPANYTKSSTTTNTEVTQDESITENKTTTTTNEVVDGRTKTTTTVVTTENVDFKTRTVETTITVATDKDAYPGMTALDFTGRGDFGPSESINGFSYTPIMDYKGIIGFNNNNQTQNMLVYADATKDATSYTHLDNYLVEPFLLQDAKYNTIAVVDDADISAVRGHLVDLQSTGSFLAMSDHYLVDKQIFNAPIPYMFSGSNKMWYQRKPDNYASIDKGSETVSLPFKAVLVTTQDKGEITHFFENDEKGHEYWLREFKGINAEQSTAEVAMANFDLPAPGVANKTDDNLFLWDYYYSNSTSQDANQDKYFEYYKTSRTYPNYPFAQPAAPYLLGLPGKTYYEFDLSGNFEPKHTYASIAKLDPQVITWASDEGATIEVSDDELAAGKISAGGYVFKPNYGNATLPVGSYVLNADGSGFDVTTTPVASTAFRPYFTPVPSTQNPRMATRIAFNMMDFKKGSSADPVKGLKVTVYRRNIVVESGLDYDRDITIMNASGMQLTRFTITPGAKISTTVHLPGVYMVAGYKVLVE